MTKYKPVFTREQSMISLRSHDTKEGAKREAENYIKTHSEWNLRNWKLTIEEK